MSEALHFLTDKWFIVHVMDRYFGDGRLFPALFALGLIYTLFRQKREGARLLGWITLILGITIYNPLVIKKIVPALVRQDIYYRLLWLLPVAIGCAYYVVLLAVKMPAKWMKVLVLAFFIGAAAFTGSINANLKLLTLPDNIYKVPEALIWVNEVIHQDYEENKEQIKASYSKFYEHLSPRCVYEDELEVFAPQYDTTIHLGINRDMRLYYNGVESMTINPNKATYKYCRRILDVLNSKSKVSLKRFHKAMKKRKINYLVVNTGKPCHEYLIKAGCTVIGEDKGYTVYRYIAPSKS